MEVTNLEDWKERMLGLAGGLSDATYNDDSGEPMNRSAQIQSVLLAILEHDIQPVVRALRRLLSEDGSREERT